MPQISKQKIQKIQEQILSYLYQIFPKQIFISNIAFELARDEEFVKNLMYELLKKGLVIKINKNPKGILYKKRARWRISNKAHQAYKSLHIS